MERRRSESQTKYDQTSPVSPSWWPYWADLPGLRVDEQERGVAGDLARLSHEISAVWSLLNTIRQDQEALAQELSQRPVLTQATLYDLDDGVHQLIMPVNIVLEIYQDETLARFPEVEAYGSGTTEGEAITQLKREIVCLFEELESVEFDELGRVPQGWRRTLERLIMRSNGPA